MNKFNLLIKLFLLIIVCVFNTAAQSDNIHITNLIQPDSRIEVSIHHNRTIGIGAQFVGVSIKNKTDHKLRVVLEFYVNLTCGEQLKQKIGFGNGIIIKPGEQTKPSGFMDTDNTSIDAGNSRSTECLKSANKSIKLPEGGSTVISSVGFTLIRIDDLEMIDSENNQSNNSGDSNDNTTDGDTGDNEDNSAGNTTNSSCRPQGLSMKGKAGEKCAEFVWISDATLSASADGSVTSTIAPDKFIFSFKKSSSLIWDERSVEGYQMGFILNGLDPCEKYDVRLQRDCGSGKFSTFSKTITFTTDCPAPHEIRAINITQTTVNISNRKMPASQYCPGNSNTNPPMRILEYKTATSGWIIKVCVSGQECPITNLKPNTTYQVRVKYQYENSKFSEYSSEKTFKTLL